MSLLRIAFGNWFSRAYLLVVAVVAVVVAVSTATWNGPDANLIGVWLFFVTGPWSIAALVLTDTAVAGVALVVSVVLGAFINATLIGLLVRAIQHRGRSAHVARG